MAYTETITIPDAQTSVYTGLLENRYLIVNSGGTAQDVTVDGTSRVDVNMSGKANNLTVQRKGKVYSYAGSIVTDATIQSGGLYYLTGGKLTGSVTVNGTIYAKKSSGGILATIDFNVKNDESPTTALYSNLSKVKVYDGSGYNLTLGEEGTSAHVSLTITVKDGYQEGDYLLAANAPVSLAGATFTLKGAADMTITVNGGQVEANYAKYTLALNESNELWLNVVRRTDVLTSVENMDELTTLLAQKPAGGIAVDFNVSDPVNDIVDFKGYMAQINSGAFNNVVTAGTSNATGKGRTYSKLNSLTINGGTFNGQVVGGDQLAGTAGSVTHEGAITFTINGGTFNKSVAGGLLNSLLAENGAGVITQNGDINLTINGGTFKSHVVGGNLNAKGISANQERSKIEGNVYTELNSSAAVINITKSVVAGSWGKGRIDGNVSVTLTGANAINIGDDLWGGCSADKYIRAKPQAGTGDRNFSTFISGSRTLSFTGFTSTLKCDAIAGFDTMVVEDGSDVTIVQNSDTTVNLGLGDIRNWEFDCISSITGNFGNNFTKDFMTISGNGSALTTTGTTLIANSNDKGYAGFGSMASVTLFGETCDSFDRDEMAYVSDNYKLFVEDGNMKVAKLA